MDIPEMPATLFCCRTFCRSMTNPNGSTIAEAILCIDLTIDENDECSPPLASEW